MKSTLYQARAITDLGCYADYFQNVTVQEHPISPYMRSYEYCQDEDATTIHRRQSLCRKRITVL